jgi:hypothetical protein
MIFAVQTEGEESLQCPTLSCSRTTDPGKREAIVCAFEVYVSLSILEMEENDSLLQRTNMIPCRPNPQNRMRSPNVFKFPPILPLCLHIPLRTLHLPLGPDIAK